MADHLTAGDVAKLYGVRIWQVRRIADRLNPDLPRAGRYRLIPREMLGDIAAELRDGGFLPTSKTSA